MSLEENVRAWLATEGYPLEFLTARQFLTHGFQVRQGSYVKSSSDECPREVDVLAYKTDGDSNIRIYNVVECKWSADKPWVIFTSETHQMANEACINQTISSQLGGSIVWAVAGNKQLTGLNLFTSPERAGFGGRQAFAKGNDLFYAAVQSVVSKARARVGEYDEHRNPKKLPEWAAVAFPVIVVEGGLFEGFMDWASGEIVVRPIAHARVHWLGSDAWKHRVSVDIVTNGHVSEFAKIRSREIDILLGKMRVARSNIELCWKSDSLAQLAFEKAPRGTIGLPLLLREILLRQRDKEARQPKLGAGQSDESKVATATQTG